MPIFRTATRSELDTIIDWAAAEGWNPGLDDAAPFWAADPEGFRVAEVDGQLAAAVSLVSFSDAYAFLGFYIAHPDFRGQGIARRLWDETLAGAGDRVIGLDGVVAEQEKYRQAGFVLLHANVRYAGRVEASEPKVQEIVEVQPLHHAMIIDHDRNLNPVRRERFLKEWLKPLETRQTFALLRGGAIAGFATLRQCREGYKIGPLYSDTEVGADLLFRKLAALTKGAPLQIDIPAPNAAARALCERYNLAPVFETARMYRGVAPDLPLSRIYGITTFELG